MVIKTFIFFLLDIISIFLSFSFAEKVLSIKFENDIFFKILVIKIIFFYFFRLYNLISKYVSVKDVFFIFSSIISGLLFEFLITGNIIFAAVDNNLLFIVITLIRFIPKIILYLKKRSSNSRRILIYGAGDAGDMIVNEVMKHPEYGISITGFLDDDIKKKGKYIHNHKIFGGISKAEKIIAKTGADEVIIAIPSADSNSIEKIFKRLSDTGIKISVLPAESELIDGRVYLKDSRRFDINDILRRTPHERDLYGLKELINGKNILVTGAGGSIGSELSRQIKKFEPKNLVLIGHGENSIFRLRKENSFSHDNVVFAIADIQDKQRLSKIIRKHRIDIIFHAAAHKHVQLMEENPYEAVRNNIQGSKNIFLCAGDNKVEKVVLISTDKAVEPVSVMGMSKRIAEKLLCYYSGVYKNTNFISVRFGNVISSRGSVIPIFEDQIKNGGPVTVTHPDVERYFMSIPEAVQLTLESCISGRSGDIFVLDMGNPVKISDIAKKMIDIYSPEKEIQILYTGLNTGEKLTEKLFSDKEIPISTSNEKIMVMRHCDIEKNFVDLVKIFTDSLYDLEENDLVNQLRELSS